MRFSESTPDRKFEGSDVGCDFSILDVLPSCQWPGLLGILPNLLDTTNVDEARDTQSLWPLRKESGFLATSPLLFKATYGVGNFQCCQDLSHLLLTLSSDSGSPAFENLFRLARWGGMRESDTWSPECQMHQSNLFRQVSIWVFSILPNSVSFSEDICLSWIKSLNGLIKST